MTRSELSFIVSRALAVWFAVSALGQLLGGSSTFAIYYASARFSFTGAMKEGAVADFMLFAGEFFLSTLLWMNAWTIFASKSPAKNQSPILSAVGLILLASGVASAIDNVRLGRAINALTSTPGIVHVQDWIAYALQACAGAVLFILFRFPNEIRRVAGFRG